MEARPGLLVELAIDYGVSLPGRGQHLRPPGGALCLPVGAGRKTACHSGEGIEHVPYELLELLLGVRFNRVGGRKNLSKWAAPGPL